MSTNMTRVWQGMLYIVVTPIMLFSPREDYHREKVGSQIGGELVDYNPTLLEPAFHLL